tara:strand:- start:1954 stop:2265 length:312 start_codon:yes stop_codon:yes gene_type:complete
MNWISIIIAGLVTYFTRMSMVTLIKKEMIGKDLRKILSYVPSVVFPSIIFPAILLNDFGNLVSFSDPKIFGAITALLIGFYTRNVILTIMIGLASYWIFIFII